MIAMNSFRSEPEALVQKQLGAVERVLRSGWYVLGREFEAFEAERHAAQCLSISCHPYLGDADVASVIAAVNAF